MVKAYNFLASWQLFPEKGQYEFGERPKSGILLMEAVAEQKMIRFSKNWVNLEDMAFHSAFDFIPDDDEHPFEFTDIAHSYRAWFDSGIQLELRLYMHKEEVLSISFSIMPDGYLRLTEKSSYPDRPSYSNKEYYHKQMQVLPYAASVSGAVIRPTKEGVIRHKALTAMEEQTHMQLEQIRRQIELLALQAQEIQKRKELSMIIYNAKLSFSPVIGQLYYLYEKNDNSHILSIISPKEWGGAAGPYRKLVAAVKLLADHTWMEI